MHFFEVLREDTDEFVDWVEQVPYSRELHERWARYYYDSPGGFATSKVQSKAVSYANKTDRLEEFAERFRDVVLENLDWRAALSKYDTLETVFYLDPQYVGKEDYYPVGRIDHEALMDALRDVEGQAICSYEELSASDEEFQVVERGGEKRFMGRGRRVVRKKRRSGW